VIPSTRASKVIKAKAD